VKLRLAAFTDSTGTGAFTVTETLANLLISATLVALTVTAGSVVTVGAVNRPAVLIVPPEADQVTD
jgi:hypothetical protein